MAINDLMGKSEIFRAVTGGRPGEGDVMGDVPEFKIGPNDVDEIYLMVKKLHRCYYGGRLPAKEEYYSESFVHVEDAYLSMNMDKFQKAVEELMSRIAFD